MTAILILSSLAAVAAASAFALVRAVRQAPEGYEAEGGFAFGRLPANSLSENDEAVPLPAAARPARRALHREVAAH